MRYIEKNENETNEYDVIINEKGLAEIIKELNEKCCRSVKVSINVRAQEDRAFENFNTIGKGNIDIVKKTADNNSTYFYECEYFRNQISYLAYLLGAVLSSYRSNADMSYVINQLIDYENNDELKTYQERMARDGITKELFDEYENNKDFDFALLRQLYEKAKTCFKLVLQSKTIHYENGDNTKTLGGR